MKKSELAFRAILVPLDYGLVYLAALTAYQLRFGYFATVRPVIFEMPIKEFLIFSAGAAIVFTLLYAFSGLYSIVGPRRLRIELSRIFLASSTAIMTLVVLIFLKGDPFESRFIILAAWAFAILYVSAGRILVRLLQRLFLRHGIGTHRVVLIGADSATADILIRAYSKFPVLGHKVAKRIKMLDEDAKQELDRLAEKGKIDEIILTEPDMSQELLADVLGYAESRHISFRYTADLLATHAKNIEINIVSGVPIVEVKGTRLNGWGRIFKRVFDIIASLILIILTSPIMLVTAIAIVIDSRGPIFFSKLEDGSPVDRVGEHGKPFHYLKFRSMKPGSHKMRYEELADMDARKDGPLVKIKDDPRVTRVGRFIRRFSIDELPEFFLVLMGKMSLVGPRPHLPEEVEKYKDHQLRVLTIKPGITGMAQVSGRADLSFEDEVKLDIYYIENWSPWLDLSILVRTPFVVLARKGAY